MMSKLNNFTTEELELEIQRRENLKDLPKSRDSFDIFEDLKKLIIEFDKENLQRIKEHNEFYISQNRRWYFHPKTDEQLLEEASTKDWFVTKTGKDADYWDERWLRESNVNLYTDEDEMFRVSAFWCGHFESLQSAEIVTAEEEGMKFEV